MLSNKKNLMFFLKLSGHTGQTFIVRYILRSGRIESVKCKKKVPDMVPWNDIV
jgi:hypothetical protein